MCHLVTRAAAALGALMWIASLSAHHSFAASYDAAKPVVLHGHVTRIEWNNPHVRFFMEVAAEDGTRAEWELEMGAVNGLLRRGWSRDMLKPADEVTVNGYLARSGSRQANARVVTLSDGRKMSGGTPPDGPAN